MDKERIVDFSSKTLELTEIVSKLFQEDSVSFGIGISGCDVRTDDSFSVDSGPDGDALSW